MEQLGWCGIFQISPYSILSPLISAKVATQFDSKQANILEVIYDRESNHTLIVWWGGSNPGVVEKFFISRFSRLLKYLFLNSEVLVKPIFGTFISNS